MKKTLLTVAFVLGLSGVLCGAEQAVFQTVSTFNGTNYRSLVLESDLVNQPKWKATDEYPPLSPRQAESAGKAKVHEMFPSTDAWKVNKISLMRVGDPGNWIYIVQLTSTQKPYAGGHFESIELVVLMDGRRIESKGEKATRKVRRLD